MSVAVAPGATVTVATRGSASPPAWALAVAVGAITFAYLFPFHGYGFQVEDEGVLLYQLLLVVERKIPYVDFLTGYTLGYFYVAAPLLGWLGDVARLRIALDVLHALTAAGLVLLAMRVARPSLAVVLALVYVAFIPVYPGVFCAFNIPYPAWFATFGWVATALALVGFVERRARALLVVAGFGAAFTFAMKPNAGLFAIAASAVVVLLVAAREERDSPVAAAVWWALWAGLVAGVVGTIGRPHGLDALIYYAPVLGLMLAVAVRRTRRARLVGDVVALLAAFAAVTVPWLGYLAVRLGGERFLREVLYVGSNAAEVFYSAYPVVTPWAWTLTLLVLAFGAVGALARRGVVPARPALAVVVTAGLAGAAAVAALGLMPERFNWSVVWQLESAAFSIALAVEVAGIVWLWRVRRSGRDEVPAVLVVCAVFMHLQLYPRADFMHLVSSATLAAVFAAFLLERACRWWEAALRRANGGVLAAAVMPAVVGLFLAAVAIRVGPTLAVLRAPARFTWSFPIAPLWIEADRAQDMEALGAAAARLHALAGNGAPSFGFPAVDAALVLSGTRNPTHYTYMFPGRPDHLEEASMIDAFAATSPAALLSLNRDFTFFDAAQTYFFMLRQMARGRYELDARHGRYDVLRRRDAPGADGNDGAASDARPDHPTADAEITAALGTLAARDDVGAHLAAIAVLARGRGEPVARALLAEATGDDATIRATAMRALLDVVARDPERGLETYVDAAHLDRVRETLLLRAIRDVREARAASYLFTAVRRNDVRIRNDALGAMFVVRASLIARSNVWGGADEPAVWPGRAALVAAVRPWLTEVDAVNPTASALAAELAGRLGMTDAATALRALLDGTSTVAVSAARSLATLAPAGLTCRLIDVLDARVTNVDMQEVLPSVLLQIASRTDSVGLEARFCLAAALGRGGAAREDVTWVAAALGHVGLTPAVRPLLATAPVRVRRAAAWTLGEIAADPETSAALARAAADDTDPVVRELAAAARAKLDGRAPRGLRVAGGAAVVLAAR